MMTVYPSIDHCSPARLACRSLRIAGSATLTMVTSIVTSASERQHVARMTSWRRRDRFMR